MKIFNVEHFVRTQVTGRNQSLFDIDIKDNAEQLEKEITGKSVLVIGGAGTIGSSYIKALLQFNPGEVYVADINENGLTELVRDLRSDVNITVPQKFLTYPVNFSDPVFRKMFVAHKGFDIVANFAAHKHVRSEKDEFSIEAMIDNNVLKAKELLDLLIEFPPKHFFCVSTDKATNPVNVMGATKKLMEDVIMAYTDHFPVTTARFANVAFSNGSLLYGFMERLLKKQPLSAPNDVRRYFVSPVECGQICLLASIMGETGDIFFPKLPETGMKKFSSIADSFVEFYGFKPDQCRSEDEAKRKAAELNDSSTHYPVYYFTSDTTGEKPYEEFYTEEEELDMDSFVNLGVIKNSPKKSMREMNMIVDELHNHFGKGNVDKRSLVALLKSYLPGFEHVETGKNLDQKM